MVYDGPQICKLLNDKDFLLSMNEIEKDAWDTLAKMTKRLLGNAKAHNFLESVNNLMGKLHKLNINMSIRVHFPFSHL